MRIAIIIPVHNRRQITLNCIKQLYEIIGKDIMYCIIIIDDGSTDGTSEAIKKKYSEVIILKGDGNLWWAGGVNKGLKYIENNVTCDYILLLNDDTLFLKDTLGKLVEVIIAHDARTVCCSVVIDEESGRIYNAGQKITGFLQELKPLYKGEHPSDHYDEIIECDSVGTRFILMPKRIIGDIGFFDQDKFPHGYSDFEYFLRAKKKGYKVLVITNSRVYTKQNRNYINHRLVDCSSSEYLNSFLDIKYNNLKLIFHQSFVRKNFFLGFLLFLKTILSHVRWITYKIILPRTILKRIVVRKWIN